ncbi:FkbM family methyltransferase [Pedobacter glucosidilyticus]|uniref:FkbM family methyltransferase n=1 Tax=Pedobacter glucosidilyticus TaxID=1122941 RepID=UPI0003F7D9F4|nr:FkbM family methyltransferase [Pedobacter glucosidilyticus]
MKNILINILSRPRFYPLLIKLQKLTFHLLNKTSVTQYGPEETGEKGALEFFLESAKTKNELMVFDVGANYGKYSKMLQKLLFKHHKDFQIHLFEPSLACYQFLITEFKNTPNIILNQLGASNFNGLANLYFSFDGSASSSLSTEVPHIQSIHNISTQQQEIQITTIDEYCIKNNIHHIDLIKIDVEGFELHVLEGCKNMLEKRAIHAIQIEIGAASIITKQFLFDFWELLNKDFEFYNILKHGLVPIKKYSTNLECFYGAANIFLINKNLA